MSEEPEIVVVGGGAAGLELATRLGRKLGKRGRAHVTLIDATRTHVWKPLLHQGAGFHYLPRLRFVGNPGKIQYRGQFDGDDNRQRARQRLASALGLPVTL